MDWVLHGGAIVGSFFVEPLLVAIVLVLGVLALPLLLAVGMVYVGGLWGWIGLVLIVAWARRRK